MEFYFIRHGQSENNRLYADTRSYEGRSDDPALTSLGRQQAEILARFLQLAGDERASPTWDPQNVGGFGLTHLYCSLMIRAVATAAVVSRVLGLPPVAWLDAHETGGIHLMDEETGEQVGQPGKNRAYFESHYPNLILPEEVGDEGWWNRPFEEREERPLRARRFLQQLLERHGSAGDRVALISHGDFYRHLLVPILKLPSHRGYWFSLNNAAITRIDFDSGELLVHYMNRADFLPRELIT
jgi:2,3-bisphosphoglycerate-dependent phosphoglycerate mutase